jgi:hypothetical protein
VRLLMRPYMSTTICWDLSPVEYERQYFQRLASV